MFPTTEEQAIARRAVRWCQEKLGGVFEDLPSASTTPALSAAALQAYDLQVAPQAVHPFQNSTAATGVSVVDAQGHLYLPQGGIKGGVLPDNGSVATMIGRDLLRRLGLQTHPKRSSFKQSGGRSGLAH